MMSLLLSNQIRFDSNKAYNFVLKQCSFGPRYPGSEGHKNCKNYLINQVDSYCKKTIVDQHMIIDPLTLDSVKIYNIFGRKWILSQQLTSSASSQSCHIFCWLDQLG